LIDSGSTSSSRRLLLAYNRPTRKTRAVVGTDLSVAGHARLTRSLQVLHRGPCECHLPLSALQSQRIRRHRAGPQPPWWSVGREVLQEKSKKLREFGGSNKSMADVRSPGTQRYASNALALRQGSIVYSWLCTSRVSRRGSER
jgi:hypothetical protein